MFETQQIELYLLNKLSPEEQLLMEANVLINEDLKRKLFFQKQTQILVRDFGRKKLKAEIEAVHIKMFSEKQFQTFSQKILNIFKK
ncbi:hypothetical protein [Aurantibacillus circumpalustris]|uniref:hypothetical protein n=1 Tax=Aurantibacillus circumpalustris TaxID=3036359 RepID=UPI00295B0FEE|nr:hypothetical protein [Aurantibacillus circumpalustris]